MSIFIILAQVTAKKNSMKFNKRPLIKKKKKRKNKCCQITQKNRSETLPFFVICLLILCSLTSFLLNLKSPFVYSKFCLLF